MAIPVEHFTAPGKYAIDKALEDMNQKANTPLEITNYEPEVKNQDPSYKTKEKKYNQMRNK